MSSAEKIHPMPTTPKLFAEGTVLTHKDGRSRYKLLRAALWNGLGFAEGFVGHLHKDGSTSGSYELRSYDDWIAGYVEQVSASGDDGPDPCSCPTGDCPTHQREQDERTAPVNGGSDLSHELAIFERQKADDEASGRRARLVAALGAEMARPVEPRFPPEGRSDRVFGGRRW